MGSHRQHRRPQRPARRVVGAAQQAVRPPAPRAGESRTIRTATSGSSMMARTRIFKFTRDGKTLVQTIGTRGVPGNDETHFARPTDIAWLPDGTFFVSDGYTNTRVVKFDRNGKYVTSWGMRGTPPNETRPYYMNTVHAIVDRQAAPRLHQRSRQPPHPGVRRERQVPRCVAEHAAAVLAADDRRPVPVVRVGPDAEVHEVRSERPPAGGRLVGNLRHDSRRLLGRAPVPRGQREQPVHGRRARRAAAEVPSEAGCRIARCSIGQPTRQARGTN